MEFINGTKLTELQRVIAEVLPEYSISVTETLEQLLNGEIEVSGEQLLEMGKELLLSELIQGKTYFVEILLLLLIFSLIQNFALGMEKKEVSEIGFFLCYSILLSLLLQSFLLLDQVLIAGMKAILTFMKALLPVLCGAMVLTGKTTTGYWYYQWTFLVVFAVEWMFFYVLIPLVHLYVVIQIMNHLWKEEAFARLLDLMEGCINNVRKGSLMMVLGMNLIQGMVQPGVDAMKGKVGVKAAQSVFQTFLGGNTIMQMVAGTSVMIRNSIGVFGMVFIAVIALVPCIKIGCMAFLYKFAGAVGEPLSDKRLTGCLYGVGMGAKLCFQILLGAALLFFLTIGLTMMFIGSFS